MSAPPSAEQSAAPATSDGEHRVVLRFDHGDSLEIFCREDEDVVAAALRQNILLVSNCREGICGSCKAEAVAGEYDMPERASSQALSEQEESDGWVLACRTQPRGELVLAFDYGLDRVDRFEASSRVARIVDLVELAPGLARVSLRTASAQAPLVPRAGQWIRCEWANGFAHDAYLLADPNAPHDLVGYVHHRDDDAPSPLRESLVQGTALDLALPSGQPWLVHATDAPTCLAFEPQALGATLALIQAIQAQSATPFRAVLAGDAALLPGYVKAFELHVRPVKLLAAPVDDWTQLAATVLGDCQPTGAAHTGKAASIGAVGSAAFVEQARQTLRGRGIDDTDIRLYRTTTTGETP